MGFFSLGLKIDFDKFSWVDGLKLSYYSMFKLIGYFFSDYSPTPTNRTDFDLFIIGYFTIFNIVIRDRKLNKDFMIYLMIKMITPVT